MRIKLKLSYVGDEFNGWQVQPDKKTVQGELNNAIKSLTGEDVVITGSGRTDTGVHAFCQVAHFDLTKNFDVKKIVSGLNFYLPTSIRILEATEVDDNFHARFSAKSKTYIYVFSLTNNALFHNKVLFRDDLDYERMADCCGSLKGKHDFSSFMSSGSDTKTTVRHIYSIELKKYADFWIFSITADGFLYNMVRKIVGTLIKVGEGKLTWVDVLQIVHKHDGTLTPVAPAHALYLTNIEY